MSNLIVLNNKSDSDEILNKAIGNYDSVVVIGRDKDDMLDVRSSSNITRKADLLYLLALVEHKLMNGDYDED